MTIHLVYGIAPMQDWTLAPIIALGFPVVVHHHNDDYAVDPGDIIIAHSMGAAKAAKKKVRLIIMLDPVAGWWPFQTIRTLSKTVVYKSWWPLVSTVKGDDVAHEKTSVAHWNQPKEMPAKLIDLLKKNVGGV